MNPPEAWPRLRALATELLELDAGERARRLEGLEPELASELVALLAASERGEELERRALAGAGELLAAWSDAVPPEPAPPADRAGTTLGPWRLERPLGRGGMAEVWEARRLGVDYEQAVAIKLLKLGMDSEEIVRRFARERQILARLEHPGIARLLDGGVAPDGRSYLVMEKVEGRPITDWCGERRLGVRGRIELLIAACDAVTAAHRLLVVHRDLKPSNLFVTGDGRVKLLDFGIAKLIEEEGGEEATRSELRLLTPAYAAPEQIAGEPVSTATDVYSLGVIAYELLAGRLPHRRKAGDAGRPLAAESLAAPSAARSGAAAADPGAPDAWSGDLDTIVLTALQRDPARRYLSVAELAGDLERYLEGRPIAARADSLVYRARKFVGRHRFGVATAALVAALAAAGVVAVAWQAERARRHAEASAANARRAQRVQRFLIEVFRGSEPGRTLGAEVTARQVLAAGGAGVEALARDEPAVAADLYDALAEIHHELGLIAEADAFATQALELRERRLPRDPELLGGTLRRLVGVRLDGERKGVLPLAVRARDLVVEGAGPDSRAAAEAEGELAVALLYAERTAEAVARQRVALDILHRGEHGRAAIAAAEIRLAELVEAADGFAEAEGLYRGAIPVLVAELGERHPSVAAARRDFAGLLDRLGRTEEAEPILRAALATQREVLGPAHWQVGETLFSYALLLNTMGRATEAEAALREALAIEMPPNVRAHVLRYLGINLAEQRRFDEAVEMLTRAVAAYRGLDGPDSIEGWRAAANLGHTELRRGRPEAAEAALREAVAALERLAGPDSYPVRLPLRQLGEALRVRGRILESIAVLRRTRALEVELFGTEDHADIALTDLQLARSLAAADSAPAREVRTLLDESVALLERHRPHSGALGEALVERGAFGLEAGEAAAACADLERGRARLVESFGPEDPRAGRAAALLGRCLR